MGRKVKKLKLILAFIAIFFAVSFASPKASLAQEPFMSIVNPIRGEDFWTDQSSPLFAAQEQKSLVDEYGISATWLLRPDVFLNEEMTSFFQDGFDGHELGVFFEITPTLAEKAKVDYPEGEKADSHRFFLSGYSVHERKKLIDTAFETFEEEYGSYPNSVGAWHIDAYSADYMNENYGVDAVMLVADRFSTDRYRVWGSWWGVPYYPSQRHVLVPAASASEKLDVVVTQWAVRDPVNGYGAGKESLYSVQPNDYRVLSNSQGLPYFRDLLDIYLNPEEGEFGHVTIGIENELFLSNRNGFEEQIAEVKSRQDNGELEIATMSEFSDWYKESFQSLSPPHKIASDDPLGTGRTATWIMNTTYRAGIIEEEGKRFLRDLRLYEETKPEPYLMAANYHQNLVVETKAAIDTVKNPESRVDITNKDLDKVVASYKGKDTPNFMAWIWGIAFVGAFVYFLLKKKKWIKKNLAATLLFLAGTVTWSLTMVKSGLLYPFGVGFWGPNGHDGVWHIAVIKSLSQGSFEMPVFAGKMLKNYHIGYDLLLAAIHRITTLPVENLYFQVFPPLLAFLVGILTYKLVKKWKGSDSMALWATFFVYFGGNFGWIMTLIREGIVGGESMFWAQQSISTLINPPFAFSLVILLSGLYLLLEYLDNNKFSLFVIISVLFGILVQIKVYAGVLVLGGLFLSGLLRKLKEEKSDLLEVFALSLLVSILVFIPFNKSASGLVVLRPGWFLETMMDFNDRFNWDRFAEAMINYRLGGQYIKAVVAYGVALLVFWVGNMGTRIIKSFYVVKRIKEKAVDSMDVIFFSLIFGGLAAPMLFLQKGTPWNTIQFFYYSLIFSGILAGIYFGGFLSRVKKSTKKVLLSTSLVLLTIPTTFGTLRHYLPAIPPARISYPELEALNFLSEKERGVVLTYPFDAERAKSVSDKPPRPLYLYESTAYVSAFSGQPVYLEDEVNLNITGYDWDERRKRFEDFLVTNDEEKARAFLSGYNIKYIYWLRTQRALLGEEQLGIEKVFENEEVTIYKVVTE